MTTDQACLEEQNLCKDAQLPVGFFRAGRDTGDRTSLLLAAVWRLAGKLAILRTLAGMGERSAARRAGDRT